MNRFVRSGSEHRCAENVLCFAIDEHLHESKGLAFLDGAAHSRHGPLADQCRLPPAANIGFGHSNMRERDRKSTRLNSSHVEISYAVFCLKKKKKKAALSISLRTTKITKKNK